VTAASLVWDDETGERYFIDGHHNRRRALAAVSRYVREACGREDRNDQLGDVKAADVAVNYRWVRPAPLCPGDDETAAWCEPDHSQASAVTVVSL
jgi:hypothetical protein